ncbi:GH92 family glycosyl hydrolase [Mucilaginibacter sp. FT3.2]|uniref:GH92 family glycosyl hydrolase n=1 Tax=Mucilaginibacter sp. FT3.2 TaxID=2723090 RepID=UPI00181BAEB2|nr:GH92 family glycosyl hydrolase [Mucilaginibacter sp. FT3.2]MBB6230404.1 putative alpha-1,2-mannosidase [Mucilaginibacter sp. FT3.2]
MMLSKAIYKCLPQYFTLVLSIVSTSVFAQDVVKYVQPLAGTAVATTASALKHGSGYAASQANTIPAVTTPFAMTQWTPETQATENKCVPPYLYKDSLFYGLRGSHWLSGSCTQDYGSFTIMPITGKLKTTGYQTSFKHTDELLTPYLYQVNLAKYQIQAAVTATPRCGIMQFTMDRADSLYLLVKPNSDYHEGYIKVDAQHGEIYGYNPAHRIYQGWGKSAGFNGFFVIRFQKAAGRAGVFINDKILTTATVKNLPGIGAYMGFKMDKGEKLVISIGTSFTSLEGARRNLNAEMPVFDFDRTVASCKAAWQKALGQINVTTNNVKDKRIFYTAYYHTMQQPRLFNDVDGSYPMFATAYKTAKLKKGNYYDDFSMWDIYRAEIPLYEILKPSFVNDLVSSLIIKGRQGGWMPIFPCWNNYTSEMIGDHTASVISSAYLKGIRDYDVNEAFTLLQHNAFDTPVSKSDYVEGKGRRALYSYLKYHYIPLEDSVPDAFHKKEQVSRTMEYAYDDYAVAQFAKKLNKKADYNALIKRAGYYKNVFDPAAGMARGRYKNGSWIAAYDADKKESYITEGTPRQYTFYVPQDIPGLAQLMGGTNKLESELDSLFLKKEYWHGNEPGHQIPFMYNYTPSPWKTQQQVREILATEYSDGPGGLGGNDDAGQMSAWYMFASMGFYPVNPISGEFLLCSPVFDKIVLKLPHGKVLTISCHKKTKSSAYIYQVKRNGLLNPNNYISYNEIMEGGRIEFFMQDKPDVNWATQAKYQPSGMVR